MKLIKQLSLALAAFFLLFVGITVTASSVFAQTQQKLMVAVTPYQPMQNLDFFFLNSVYPLQYIEGENPVFVSIITPEQKTEYEKAGYKPRIIDENAGDVNQYYIMSTYHHNTPNFADQLQNPEYKQQGLELAYQLSTYMILLKVSDQTSFSQLAIPILKQFNARRLKWNLVPPTGRTSVAVQQAFPFSPSPVPYLHTSHKAAWIADPAWVLSFVFLIAIVILLSCSLKRKKK
jgi:hypothetical protein